LKDQLGDTLTGQVAVLRTEKDQLRTALDTAQAGVQHRDDFVTAVMPTLLAQQLGGRTVALITLPGVEEDSVALLKKALGDAGAEVTGTVGLTSAWVGSDQSGARERLATRLQEIVPRSPTGETADEALAGQLTRALVTQDIAVSQRADHVTTQLLDRMGRDGFATVKATITKRATEAVVLVPAVQSANGSSSTPTVATQPDARIWVNLARSLDSGSDGVVLTGPASSARVGGVVAALRGTPAASQQVSTVDTGGAPMGVVTTVLALREQLTGTSGGYGFGDGAGKNLLPSNGGTDK